MKRAWRIGGTVLCIGAAVWLLRAVYLYRVWTMATIWYGSAPLTLSPWTYLSPSMQATMTNGINADTVFLRIPSNAKAAIRGKTALVLPLALPDKSACGKSAILFSPHSTPVEAYRPCYGDPAWFAVNAAKQGEAYRSESSANGGFVLRDDAHNVVYVAAYRTYP